MALTVPSAPATKTTIYTDLRGVDFSQDASLVDRQHSPDMLNMISDEGGSPVKRKGWEILYDALDEGYEASQEPTFTHYWHFQIGDLTYHLLAFTYKSLTVPPTTYQALGQFDPTTGTLTTTAVGTGTQITDGFFMNDAFYVIAANGLWKCKPNSVTPETLDIAQETDVKVPVTIIQRDPANGGGTAYYDYNLLTSRRTEQFKNTGGNATEFLLVATTKTTDSSTVPTNMKLEYLDSNGEWQNDSTVTYTRTTKGSNYIFKAKITTAHAYPSGFGQADNIRITYTFGTSKAARILGCTNHAFYSHGGLDQVFTTGNKNYPNYVWYSDYGDPTYFPDLNYVVIGSAGTRCKGFLNVGENLAVIKEQSEQDSSLFFIYETSITSTTTNTDTGSETTQNYSYAVRRASSNVGAISNRCFSILQDEPLFLSEDGVHGIVSTNTTSEKVVRNRSRHLDRKLLAETNLDKAISCVYNGYYYIFVNGNVYILDSRHTTSDRRGNTNYVYEGYYWNNVPANCVCVADDTIYFGTADGKICRFKNTGNLDDYSDGSHYDSEEERQVGGTAIMAMYTTRNDDDGAPQYFKTMMKKGTMCTVAPFARSSVDVYIRTDSAQREDTQHVTVNSLTTVSTLPLFTAEVTGKDLELEWDQGSVLGGTYTPVLVNANVQYVGTYEGNVGDLFSDIDFEHLTFDLRDGPRDFFFRKKKKKYVRIQLILINDEIDQGFGVFHIVKTYSLTRYAK